MSKTFFLPFLLVGFLAGCTGSGAVNPLTPKKASQAPKGSASDVHETVFWSSFPVDGPLSASLQDVCLVSEKVGFICGTAGTVLRYDGSVWKRVDTGVGGLGDLYACSFPNENEGWVVGGHGALLAYRDGKWSQETPLTDETLYDVVVTKSRRGWAVGTNGTLLSYNGTTWEKVAVSTSADLSGVGLSDENRGWAVGDRGTLIRYDGSTWMVSADSPISDKVHKVFAINDVDAWGVCSYGNLIHYNGTAWSRVPSTTAQELYGVWMNDSQDGWAVGQDGLILRYDGGRWALQPAVMGKPTLNAVAFAKKNTGFIVGQNGTLLKFQPGGVKGSANLRFSAQVAPEKEGEPPTWKVVFNVLNEGGKPVTGVELQAILPKGCSPVKSAPVTTEEKGAPVTVPAPATPAVAAPGIPPRPQPRMAPVADTWRFTKGVLSWNLANLDPAASKSVTVTLTREAIKKKDAKRPALSVRVVAASGGKGVAEGGPFVLESEFLPPKEAAKAATAKPTQTPTPASTDKHAEPKTEPPKP